MNQGRLRRDPCVFGRGKLKYNGKDRERSQFVLSRETIERQRRLSLSERLRLTLAMIRETTPYLVAGPPAVVERRFKLLAMQNDERNRRMLEGLARTRSGT